MTSYAVSRPPPSMTPVMPLQGTANSKVSVKLCENTILRLRYAHCQHLASTEAIAVVNPRSVRSRDDQGTMAINVV
jgi:hypothetical protein